MIELSYLALAILCLVGFFIGVVLGMLLYSACAVSGNISRDEERRQP